MKRLCITILFLTFILVCNSQKDINFIYNKDAVYKYEVIHAAPYKKENVSTIYLVCYGTPWLFDSLRQNEINWAYSFDEIFKSTPGTGVVENNDRIWLHPPRKNRFSILEYSPFPLIQFPLEVNKKWTWELALGKCWANKELGVKGKDLMKYEYVVVSQEEIKVDFLSENIKCYKVDAHSINPKFKSELISYFSPKYGFVRMEYKNRDESTIQFELVDIPTMKELEFLNTYISK